MPSETWIDECSFEKIEPAIKAEHESILIEGGWDTLERVDIRDEEDTPEHVFKVVKRTDLFEIHLHWGVEPNEKELEDDDLLKSRVKNQLSTESSYQAAHYLKSMGLPPLQGLFADSMAVELVPGEDEDSNDD